MKDLMMFFGVTLGKRYTPRQKNIFLSEAKKYFEKLGYKISYQVNDSKFSKTINMIIGEPDKSSAVVVCAYDTPSSVLIPNYLYYPFNIKKNLKQENINLIFQFILMSLCFAAAYYLLSPYKSYSLAYKIVSLFICGILGFVAFKLMSGSANRVNFNRCSASVALIGKLAQELKDRKDISFVLLDQSVNSFEGLKLFKKHNKACNRVILYLDSLAYGTNIACAHNERMKEIGDLLVHHLEPLNIINKTYKTERCQETMLNFSSNMLVLTSGEIINGQLAAKNTRCGKDYQIDMNRLEKIEKGLEFFLCEV